MSSAVELDAGGATVDGDGLRRDLDRTEQSRRIAWLSLLAFVFILVSFFSAGLFLYAVVVVVAVFAASTWTTESARRELQVRRHMSAAEVELGAQVHAQVVLENAKPFAARGLFWQDRVDPGLDVEGARGGFQTLAAGGKARLQYRLHTTRRGFFRIGPLVVEASDPLGLVRSFQVDDNAAFLTVLPRTVAMGQGWPLGHQPVHQTPRRRSLFEDPSRFLGIRAYRRGDGLRRVHWRATARSGELQVKVFEPSVLSGLLLAVDMGADRYRNDPEPRSAAQGADNDPGNRSAERPGENADEELVITTAASLGRFVLEGGQRLGLLSNGADAVERYPADWQGGTFRRYEDALAGDGGPSRRLTVRRPVELEPGRGETQQERLQVLLARLCPAEGASLADILQLELPRLPRSLVVMVVTSQLDDELVAAVAALQRSGFECSVVWAKHGDQPTPQVALPESVPLYRVRRPSDLEHLGNQRL